MLTPSEARALDMIARQLLAMNEIVQGALLLIEDIRSQPDAPATPSTPAAPAAPAAPADLPAPKPRGVSRSSETRVFGRTEPYTAGEAPVQIITRDGVSELLGTISPISAPVASAASAVPVEAGASDTTVTPTL